MTPLELEILQVINQIPGVIEKAFTAFIERHPGHANQKTHGNRYGGFSVSKESLRRLKDDKMEREKYKARARKKIGARPKSQPEKTKGPAGTPVSSALNTAKLPKSGKTGPKVRETLAVIDSVHGDGALPEIPIGVNSSTRWYGMYKHYTHNGAAKDIVVSSRSTHPMITTAHEVGHFLDHKAGFSNAPTMYQFATQNRGKSPEMNNLLGAIGKSKAYSSLEGLKGKQLEIEYKDGLGNTRTFKTTIDRKHISYLQKPEEAFARAYSQYVATKSNHPGMMGELNNIRSTSKTSDQWDDDDFAPISKGFDDLFTSKGYIK